MRDLIRGLRVALLPGHLTACSDVTGRGESRTVPIVPTVPPNPGTACGGVGGTVRVASVMIPERGTRATLPARVYAPDATVLRAPCPLVSVLPGGGADITSVAWTAERPAASGHVVIITLPSSGASTAAYHVAAVSGIDYLQSPGHPYRIDTDTGRVGVAGWSLGARTHRITNAMTEGLNAKIQWITDSARGYRDREAFKMAICFHCGGPDLATRVS
jgi:hypothetical protein